MTKENNQQEDVFKQFNIKNLLWPVFIGLAVIVWLILKDFDLEKLKSIELTPNATFWLILSMIAMIIRHLFFMWRLKILTDDEFSWRQCFQIISLWEFSSTATPSAVGGTAVALPLINKEGISIGRTTAIILVTIFLDGLFFTFVLGGLWIFLGDSLLSGDINIENAKKVNWAYMFLIGFTLNIFYFLLIAYGLFINPKPIRWIFEKLFSLPFINRWRQVGEKAGEDLLAASEELRHKDFSYWYKSFIATALGWACRLAVVNFVILTVASNSNQLLIFARSIVIFLVMVLIPTPGSSGAAELSFTNILSDFIPDGAAPALAFVWRIFTYFIFLPLGMVILPIWIRRVFKKERYLILNSIN